MKLFAISTFFLSARLAVSAPLEQHNDKKKHAPSVKDFKDALEAKNIGADKSIFYTGGGCASRACINYRKAHGLTKIQDVPVLGMYDPGGYEEDAAKKAVENWSRAFAEVSSGVAWVMFKDSSAIDENRKSVWIKEEWPGLKQNDDVEEIIQIDGTDTSKIQQIWPVEIRKEKGTCAWHGEAPKCDDASCPDGTKKKAESRYGSDTNVCTSGKKVYCCKD